MVGVGGDVTIAMGLALRGLRIDWWELVCL